MTRARAFSHFSVQEQSRDASVLSACLQVAGKGPGYHEYPVTDRPVLLGRDSDRCDIVIQGASVSRVHARIEPLTEGTFQLADLDSTNGVYLNNHKILGPHPLRHNDIIGLGIPGVGHLRFLVASAGSATGNDILPAQPSWSIGRSPGCAICLPFTPTVSSCHAVLKTVSGRLQLTDRGSLNGTWVNSRPVHQAMITVRDTVIIGGTAFHFHLQQDGSLLIRRQRRIGRQGLFCRGVSNSRPLLNEIDIRINPGEFIALLGPSGAGKTSLLKALSGQLPPDAGTILLDGVSLYEHRAMFRDRLAYVPQDDILHQELDIETCLDFIARLRLPGDISTEQRNEIVDHVLAILDINNIRERRVGHLSGGQRKRVSIGAELLTRPAMILLDEPTSGLDPGMASRLMHHFQAMARAGTTVIMTTHDLDHIVMVDKIALLAQGHLVFFGHPDEAVKFFNQEPPSSATSLVNIFHLLDRGPGIDDHAKNRQGQHLSRGNQALYHATRYRASEYRRHHIEQPGEGNEQQEKTRPRNTGTVPRHGRQSRHGRLSIPRFPVSARTLLCLAHRHFRIRMASPRRVLIYALIPLLLALVTMTLPIRGFPDPAAEQARKQQLELRISQGGPGLEAALKNLLAPDRPDDSRSAASLLYGLQHQGPGNLPIPISVVLMGIMTAVFLGTVVTCLELSAERSIYMRERQAGMKIGDYLGSKLPFCMSMTGLQCLLFVCCCSLHPVLAGLPFVPVFLCMVVIAWTSSAMGLCISALDPTSGRFSILLAVAAILPQFILSGGLGPDFYKNMAPAVQAVASLFPARWGLEMGLAAIYSTYPNSEEWIADCVGNTIGFDYGSTVYYHGTGVLAVQAMFWLLLCAWLLKRRDPV